MAIIDFFDRGWQIDLDSVKPTLEAAGRLALA